MSVDAGVRASWFAWTIRFEGLVLHLYRDVRGLATVGLGCLVESAEASVALPWHLASGAFAGVGDVRDDWARVMAMPPGLAASAYGDPDGLYLPVDAVDALALARLDADVAELERHLGPLDALPTQAQQVAASIAWACGADWPATWPHLVAAYRARDWAAALAPEVPARAHPDGRPVLVCDLDERGNPGLRARNAANDALLLELAWG